MLITQMFSMQGLVRCFKKKEDNKSNLMLRSQENEVVITRKQLKIKIKNR